MLGNIQNRHSVMDNSLALLQKALVVLFKPLIIFISTNYRFLKFSPPGHFYSPIPDIKDIRANSNLIFDRTAKELAGIDVGEKNQIAMAKEFARYHDEIPFSDNKTDKHRYYLDNEFFSYGDAVSLYSMMRNFKPRRIVEVGSGHSSAEMLDINEIFFDNKIELTFIEPYPDRLLGLLKTSDKDHCNIIKKPVQETPESVFQSLRENDILFIDSSHVAKTHSDVLKLIHDILPSLNKGVVIHFHDILWPFEYPKMWLDKGRAWNEAYFLRTFMQYNSAFEILYFNSFMECHHNDFLKKNLPTMLKVPSSVVTPGNTSLWLRKAS